MTRWAMVIDLRRCVGCQACTVACQIGNDLPLGMFWNIVTTVGPQGTYPDSGLLSYSTSLFSLCRSALCILLPHGRFFTA